MSACYVYILRCADDSYYVGSTDDLRRRLDQHDLGLGSSWTKARLPLVLVWQSEPLPDRDQATRFERQIKRWRREKKEALIRGEWDALPALSRKPGKEDDRHG